MNNAKILNIIQQVAASLDIKLHTTENTYSDVRCEGRVKGVEIYLYCSQAREKNKVQAYFSVGSSHRYYEPHFSKKITFSDTKTKNAIFKDLMERLEVDKIIEKVEDVLNYRAKQQQEADLKNAELSAFQRFIPFENTNFRGMFSCRKNGAYFELSQNKDQLNINIKNKDILIRICAAVAQILEEEAK